jgi:hypothetical protein
MRYVVLVTVLCLSFGAQAEEKEELVKGFCYALQASMICDALQMRSDTEGKVERKVGGKFRGPKTQLNRVCISGLMRAFEEEGKGLCENAWREYGCAGSIEPNLIQQNSFKLNNPRLCVYQ